MNDQRPLQRRVLRLLVAAQILGGIGMGATVSVGALLAADVSGSDAWSGMASTMSTLGAAVFAVPFARAAQARGRRVALATGSALAGLGAVLATVAAAAGMFPLLLLAFALTGAGAATNLQARFAATDLAEPDERARHLSLVVWSTTIGVVLGPNLIEPGEAIGSAIGLPTLTGPFVFTVLAQFAVTVVYFTGLRPDPLLTALRRNRTVGGPPPVRGIATLRTNAHARYAVAVVTFSHTTMVAVMAMTPVHLYHHGASLGVVGFALSLHVAGMYALSPVFGALADRFGRVPTILLGQGLFVSALLCAWLGSESELVVTVGLVLLGLGWSASTIAGSTLVTEAVPVDDRAGLQGASDLTMNGMAAAGGAAAGPVLAWLGYSGLGLVCLVFVGIIVAWTALRRTGTPTVAGV